MDPFRETALGLSIWYAFLAILTGVLLILLNDVDTATALLVGANIALLFAVFLMAKARSLKDNAVAQTMWRALPPHERPRGRVGQRMAQRTLAEMWLRFARGAAVVAILLCALAYASHGPRASAQSLDMTISDSAE